MFKSFNKSFEFIVNSFSLKFSSVIGNSDALIEFKLNRDLFDSSCNLLSPVFSKFIWLPEGIFLTISNIIDEEVVVLPSSKILIFEISFTNIKSKSVAVIFNFEFAASIKIFERIGKVLLFSITPWQ